MAINWPKRSKKSVKNQFFAICGRTVGIQVFIYSSFERQRWGLSVFQKKFGFQRWVFLWMTKRWPKNQFFSICGRTVGGLRISMAESEFQSCVFQFYTNIKKKKFKKKSSKNVLGPNRQNFREFSVLGVLFEIDLWETDQ